MKKTLCLLGILGIISSPAFANGIPYVTYKPYKPYTKEIKLDKISNQNMENYLINIEKNKFEFKYVTKMGYAYEYILTNKTEKDILLKGVSSDEFYNSDLLNRNNKPFKNVAKAAFASGKVYIPIYGNYYACRCDLEKGNFIRNFPQNKVIKAGESLKILASATKEHENPIAEFIFIVNDEEKTISF